MDGIGQGDLSVANLVDRVSGGSFREVILALNATVDGQITAQYIAEQLEPAGVTVSRLAHGLSVGGELDHLDDGTLAKARAHGDKRSMGTSTSWSPQSSRC